MKATLDTLALRVLLGAFPGTTLPDDYRELLADGLGGICWFGSNTAGGTEALARLGAQVRSVSPRAVIAVDEEGGDVTRLHATRLSPVPGPAVLGAVDDLSLTRAVARSIGSELTAVGVNLDLGPVADVNTNPDNPVIGTRSFGTDPAAVAEHVAAWVAGLQEAGVAACVKHFPGHGDTAEDSHLALPRLDVDVETLAARELVPFAAAVSASAASVMTSHIVVSALDPDLPATLSAPVLALLRERLGFEGVIVSDALDMAGASAGRGIPEAAVLSLASGVDLLCLGPERPATSVREVQAAIVAAVTTGRLDRQRLLDAVARIDRMVAGLAPASSYDMAAERLTAAARQALLVEGDLPDLTGASIVSVSTRANIAVGDVPWGLEPDLLVTPSEDIPDDGPVVVQVRDAHRRPDVVAFLGRIVASGRPAVVVEWGWPGPYDGALARICTRGVSGPGVRAVTGVLSEQGWTR
jgi:beta-N-acetylhexosaminidase